MLEVLQFKTLHQDSIFHFTLHIFLLCSDMNVGNSVQKKMCI